VCVAQLGCEQDNVENKGNHTLGADASAGRRLVSRQWVAPGAPPFEQGIFDTLRGQDCLFQHASDGLLRCLPAADDHHDVFDSGFFADSDCKRPVYHRGGVAPRRGEDSMNFSITLKTSTTCGGPLLHEVLQLAPAPPSTTLYNGSTHLCAKAGTAEEVFRGTEILVPISTGSPTDWVQGMEDGRPAVTPGARLAAKYVRSFDGGRFAVGLFDNHWQRACQLTDHIAASVGTKVQCWPPHAVVGSFADADCKIPLAVSTNTCETPAFIRGERPGEFLQLPKPWSDNVFQRVGKGGCEVQTQNDLPASYPMTGVVLPETAVASLRVVPQGSGRLRLNVLQDETGQKVPYARWALDSAVHHYFDAVLKANCDPVHTTTSGLRCLSTNVCSSSWTMFADASCKQRVLDCDGAPGEFAVLTVFPSRKAVHSIKAKFTGSVKYWGEFGHCDPIPGPFSTSSVLLGEEVGLEAQEAFWSRFEQIEESLSP
jgi:hypothetical protein